MKLIHDIERTGARIMSINVESYRKHAEIELKTNSRNELAKMAIKLCDRVCQLEEQILKLKQLDMFPKDNQKKTPIGT